MSTLSPAGFKLDVGGTIRCTTLTETSAREFKQDIIPLSNALDSVMKLQGVSYTWNDLAPEDTRGKPDIGFIADEVVDILPAIVAKDQTGKPIGIDYGKISAVTVEALKELRMEKDAEIASLLARLERKDASISSLLARMDRLESQLAAVAAAPRVESLPARTVAAASHTPQPGPFTLPEPELPDDTFDEE